MIRTFETRIGRHDAHLSGVLDAVAQRFNRAKRKAVALKAAIAKDAKRHWNADAYRPIYEASGLNSIWFRSVTDELNGQIKSVMELTKLEVSTLGAKISAKQKQINKKRTALDKDRAELSAAPAQLQALLQDIAQRRAKLRGMKTATTQKALVQLKKRLDKADALRKILKLLPARIDRIKADLHQHERRLGNLQAKLNAAEKRLKFPSIAFGTKKLFNAQHHLKEIGYRNHAQWKAEWQASRNASFLLVGAASVSSGNELAKLTLREDGLFDLELRLPPGLTHLATSTKKHAGVLVPSIHFSALSFNVGQEAVAEALADKRPITVRFLRDGKSWKIYVTIDQAMPDRKVDWSRGALGVDLNVGHVAVTRMDADGNPIGTWNIPCELYGKSANQAKDVLRKVAAQIRELSPQFGCLPVVSERLDFSGKKARITADDGARYARMLSSFAYSSFDAALASALRRAGIVHWRVNPAFTSIIGRVKFARRYGLSVHAAAALCIARRAVQFSERLPNPASGILEIPTGTGGHVALSRPVRIGNRHVWSAWGKVGRGYKAALAAHRRRRALGPPSTGGGAVRKAA